MAPPSAADPVIVGEELVEIVPDVGVMLQAVGAIGAIVSNVMVTAVKVSETFPSTFLPQILRLLVPSIVRLAVMPFVVEHTAQPAVVGNGVVADTK